MTTVLTSRLRFSLFSDFKRVCHLAGLNPDGAHLVRYTMNAVWALDKPRLIVRMTADDRQGGNSPAEVVRIASLLRRARAPIAATADELWQPLKIDGWSATFWRLLRPLPTEQSASATAIVSPLRALHELAMDPHELPLWDITTKIDSRLGVVAAAHGRQRSDLELWASQSVGLPLRALIRELRGRLDRTRADLQTARWRLTPGVIHGDAHSGNLVMADDGHAVWCDLDSVAFGPREWDLVPAAFGLLRFGRDPSNYAQFANAYGFDVMSDARMPSPAEVVLMILVPPAGMLLTMTSVYEAAGGTAGLLRLAQAWHSRVMADEVVSHAFSHGFHPRHSERLAAYWAEALGGPTIYSETYGGETSVVRMHSGNGPHEEMDRRAIACFDQALEDSGRMAEPLRRVLHDYFAWATTTTMSRYPESADDVPLGLAIPRWSWDGLQS